MADLLMILSLCCLAYAFSLSCNCCAQVIIAGIASETDSALELEGGLDTCSVCTGATEARDMQVALTGFSDDTDCTSSPSCATAFNGTHTLTFSAPCQWAKTGISACGGSTGSIELSLNAVGSNVKMDVGVKANSGDVGIGWTKTFSGNPIDCSTFSSEDLGTPSDSSSDCDNSSGTCTVTSL